MLKIGVTGGIGSGKSLVCKIFETLGIPVYNSDKRAKWLMNNDPELKAQLIELFGPEAFKEGQLNRPFIADIVFSQAEMLKKLNGLVHPAVAVDTLKWFDELSLVPFAIKEAALIYEIGMQDAFDKVIVVAAPEQIRLDRVMSRDKAEESEVRSRMAKQLPEAEKVALADYVIVNDGIEALIPQVYKIYLEFQ